ncbi:MAG TPA: iron chelate uptake ABC transporter family permease subunit [Miltoncostaeaceae bacterium]|nr:iron chelate uptake ABC transporter family permease subunit [Miltoncostaeaceae bacterium]
MSATTTRRALGLAALSGLLLAVVFLGFALGARPVPLAAVIDALASPVPGDPDHTVVRELRVPRTLIGVAAGAALGLAGAVIQGATRNPIADPGILGLGAGASLAVVVAITWVGVGRPPGYAWFAVAGTAVAALVVFGIGALGRDGAAPARLALVGAAFTAAATSLTTLVLLGDLDTLDRYRFWVVGSLAGRDAGTLVAVLPLLLAGAIVALGTGRALDAMALGDDVARGLGHRLGLARVACAVAVVLLCGGATALVGPIVFVGLITPHLARRLAGPDHRWILRYSPVLGAIVLVSADVVGRLIAPPGELEAGIVLALVGAPVMIAVVRRTRAAAL